MARLSFLKLWLTRWTVWEYLPWWVANIPVYLFWLGYALRARHFFFFANVNPAIPLGGALGESKSDILRLLPDAITPKWTLTSGKPDMEQIKKDLENAGISLPVIAKPDVGERGFLVKKIEDFETLEAYLSRWPVPFILQEFLTLPREASVLFYCFPGENGVFGITSVCLKQFMQVTGDGHSTVRELMSRNVRSAFQLPRFEKEFPEILDNTPAAGETLLLEPIGNHARGTMFLNGNSLINERMLQSFEPLCRQIAGVQYARFDLKFKDTDSLQRGEFQTMELNGVLGEPAHIYDPAHGMWRAYRDLYRHWRLLYRLHRAQKKRGILPPDTRDAWKFARGYFAYKKRLKTGHKMQ